MTRVVFFLWAEAFLPGGVTARVLLFRLADEAAGARRADVPDLPTVFLADVAGMW